MEISDIKQRLPILQLLQHYNLKPDRHAMLRCPFHADEKASMKIYPETNTFNCFGCGANGDVIEFIGLMDKCTKHEAILKAGIMVRGELSLVNEKLAKSELALTNNHLSLTIDKAAILTKIFTTFKNGLQSSTKAIGYLKSRNLWPLDTAEAGYNSGQFHHRGALSQAEKQACIEAGLLIPYNGTVPNGSGTTYTAFAKDCIIFPLKDKEGNIISLYGRSIIASTDRACPVSCPVSKARPISAVASTTAAAATTGKHYYLKDRHGLYPGYPNPNTTKLILTEAIIDAATLLMVNDQSLINNEKYQILACYGTNGLTEEHKAAIKEWAFAPLGEMYEGQRGREIIIFFDGDKAGRDAAQKYAPELVKTMQCNVSIVDTPEGEDINSLSVTYEKEIFTHLLETRLALSVAEESESEKKAAEEKKTFLLPEKNEEQKKESFPAVQTLHAMSPQECKPACAEAQAGRLNTRNPDYITFITEGLHFTIIGGINLHQIERLRITLKISSLAGTDRECPVSTIRHTFDLYNFDYLDKFITKASEQLETGTTIIRNAIARLTQEIEAYRLTKIESMKEQKPKQRELSQERVKRAISYLEAPSLMDRTNQDIGKTGVIGEEDNRLLMYMVFTSRLREQPLHIVSLGSSGTGKTYLQEKISALIPEADKLEITILSENAFYYFGRKELKHKLILIEDLDGAMDVLYPLRELQSKQLLTKTLPIKNNRGKIQTETLYVEGPICLAGTTTKEKLYEDNSNRSILIYLDVSHQHWELIMDYQRMLSAGKINTGKENEMKEFFKDMQTVLKPIKVRNPYAQYLKLPSYVFKPLRTNAHYLAFIETITFYHQYQREIKYDRTGSPECEPYIETTLEDIEWANKLLKEVLLAKSDELSGECRSFFENVKSWLTKNNKKSFYKNEIREAFRMNPNNLKYYLYQLHTYNRIKIVGGNRYKLGFEYEVSNDKDYNELSQGIDNVLDTVLNNIKQELVGSVDNRG